MQPDLERETNEPISYICSGDRICTTTVIHEGFQGFI
eukprot:SAG31_NODE_43141_length_268_cov_0.881657_1_plen_36_part_01